MKKATDPVTGLRVEPNPHARAVCPFCAAPMCAKCGDEIVWHWAHIGPTCQEWEDHAGEPGDGHTHDEDPRATCPNCFLWQRGCKSTDPAAQRWGASWCGPSPDGVAAVIKGAPQCPAFVQEQWIDRARWVARGGNR